MNANGQSNGDGSGRRIRRLRLQREMTGTELARRCDVTKGLISQIERNMTAPSLDVLAPNCQGSGCVHGPTAGCLRNPFRTAHFPR